MMTSTEKPAACRAAEGFPYTQPRCGRRTAQSSAISNRRLEEQ